MFTVGLDVCSIQCIIDSLIAFDISSFFDWFSIVGKSIHESFMNLAGTVAIPHYSDWFSIVGKSIHDMFINLNNTIDIPHYSDWFSSAGKSINATLINLASAVGTPHYSDSELDQITFGSCLGDAYLQFTGANTRFGFTASAKFEDYFKSIYAIYGIFCSAAYRSYSYFNPTTNKVYNSFNFWTRSHHYFNHYYKVFYIDGFKHIPADLTLLTPLAIAHWLMQDGTKGTSGGFIFCTEGFLNEDVVRLAQYLTTQYGLTVSTQNSPNKKGLRIYVWKCSVPTLISIVKPHMHPQMMYKLDYS